MAYAKATLIRRIRQRVEEDPWQDTVTSDPNTTDTSLTVADATKWAVGDWLEWQDDGELSLVRAASGTTLTVLRGYQSDTPGTGSDHAINTRVAKRPRVRYKRVEEAISSAIDELWPFVYAPIEVTVTPDQDSHGYYSVDATVEWLSSATQESTSGFQVHAYGGLRSDHPIDIIKNLRDNVPVTSTTGRMLFIPQHYNFDNPIHVVGIRRVTDEVTGSNYDDLDEGVPVQCVINMVIAELLESGDIKRLSSDVEMGDRTVVPGRRTAVGDTWKRKGLRYRRQWRDQLEITYPLMQSRRQRFM